MAFRPVRIHIPSREEFWNRWRRLAGPSLFFLAVIYYEELFLKLYCFLPLPLWCWGRCAAVRGAGGDRGSWWGSPP